MKREEWLKKRGIAPTPKTEEVEQEATPEEQTPEEVESTDEAEIEEE